METGLRPDPEHTLRAAREALALLDMGRIAEARAELARALGEGADAFEAEVADDELEAAFDGASSETEVMVDADDVAMQAMRAAELDEPELVAAEPGSPFRTETMAGLLERQGDARGADAVRAGLASDGRTAREPARAPSVVHTLERWLNNVRRGDA